MSERSLSTDGIERRGFLSAVAVGLGGAGLSHHALARESNDATYVLEQGGRCVPITPLSGDETVEEFYDYRTPNTDPSGPAYSSYGTTDLQRPETSICFLYDGPDGLSLVVVHDELNDGTNGGAVTFRFGNLTTGEWVVGDDIYDGESNYDRFQETEDGWKIDWTWSEGRSDGGAYRPLGDDFAVTIDPAFNEDAALYGDPYEGEIADWQLLSGDRADPDRVSLSLTDPVTIRAGGCGGSGTPTTVEETTQETTAEEETTEEEQSEGSLRLDVEVVPGQVNPKSHGRLPVVVHSSAEFDATTLEPGSVELHPGGAAPGKRVRTDANGDGRTDLKLLFWMDATGIDGNTDTVELSGRTRDGREVAGTADVRLVSHGDDDDDDRDDEDDRGEGEKERDHEENERDDDDEEDDDDEWEEKEEELEEKREKEEEKLEEEREKAEEKWEEKEEKMEEKWEEKEEKWEKKKEKHEDEREDDDD